MVQIILLFFLHLVVGQFKDCTSGSQCHLITDCPELKRLVNIGGVENHQKIRSSICGFSDRAPKVCCPRKIHPSPLTTASRPQIQTKVDLLPKICGSSVIGDKIIRGTEVELGSYPWMVAMGYQEFFGPKPNGNIEFNCAGALINNRYVLTAAHCLDKKLLGNKRLTTLHLGDHDLKKDVDCKMKRRHNYCAPPHIVAGVEEIISHPDYNLRADSSDDVALIRLNVSIDFEKTKGYVHPICLPPKGIKPRTIAGRRSPIASGWGITEFQTTSNILLEAQLPFVDSGKCKAIWPDRFLENEQLCVGGTSEQDTCKGDSGGPLILSGPQGPPYLQVGIVAYGIFPCGLKQPGVYTSVGPYRDWILENLKP